MVGLEGLKSNSEPKGEKFKFCKNEKQIKYFAKQISNIFMLTKTKNIF